MYDGYKATRKGMPEELRPADAVWKKLLADLGFVMVSKEGYRGGRHSRHPKRRLLPPRGNKCYLATVTGNTCCSW